MGLYFAALTIVVALFFVQGDAGYLIAVVCLCYVVFDIVCAYGESAQKKMRDEMRELAQKLQKSEEEDAALELESDNSEVESSEESEISDGEIANDAAVENEASGDEHAEGDVDADAACEELHDGVTSDEELSEEELAKEERKREAEELLTPAMRAKYKGLEGKELEYAIAKDKVQGIISGFSSSESKTA